MSTVYEAYPRQFPASHIPEQADEDAYPSYAQDTYFNRSAEDITADVLGKRDAPQKSMIRKILNIAAKLALVAAAVLFVKKACFAAVSATISSPFSLALTIPGVILWHAALKEDGANLISKINCKINDLI